MANFIRIFRFSLLSMMFGILSCSHSPKSDDSKRKMASDDEPYSCEKITRDNKGSIEGPVKGEQYCKRYRDQESAFARPEEEEFEKLGRAMVQIQNNISEKNPGSSYHRGFHAKHHGCLVGVMRVRDETPNDARHGLFSTPGKTYKIIGRFSNASGDRTQADNKPDARGFAIKVLGSDDAPISNEESHIRTQDFLMTNQASANGKDAAEFMEFAVAMNKGPLPLLNFLKTKPKLAKVVFEVPIHHMNVHSMATERYWAKTPFRLGEGQAVKFLVKPVEKNPPRPTLLQWASRVVKSLFAKLKNIVDAKTDQEVVGQLDQMTAADVSASLSASAADRRGPSFLTDDLVKRAKNRQIQFGFYVQFQGDPAEFPVEDGLHVWDEDKSKPDLIADITFFKQDFAQPDRQEYCENLSFSPWHNLTAHEPLGNLNRGRRVVYRSSSDHRHSKSSEPTVEEVEAIFGPFEDQIK